MSCLTYLTHADREALEIGKIILKVKKGYYPGISVESCISNAGARGYIVEVKSAMDNSVGWQSYSCHADFLEAFRRSLAAQETRAEVLTRFRTLKKWARKNPGLLKSLRKKFSNAIPGSALRKYLDGAE